MSKQDTSRWGLTRIRIILTVFVLLALPLTVAAGGPGQRHCLWLIEKEGRTNWVLGSIHVMPRTAYPVALEIEEVYRDARCLVFEADLDDMRGFGFLAKVALLGMLPLNRTLKQAVSESTYAALERRAALLGGSMKAFDRMRPWMCVLTLQTLQFARLGFDPRFGVDQHFYGRAKQDGKSTLALEAAEEQLDLLMGWDGDGDTFLRRSLKEMRHSRNALFQIYLAWRRGDVDKLERLLTRSFKSHPEIREALLLRRNRRWAGKLDALLGEHEGQTLVIVGALHLVGPENVLDLLRGRGYRVSQR